jgi:hypothetical protein
MAPLAGGLRHFWGLESSDRVRPITVSILAGPDGECRMARRLAPGPEGLWSPWRLIRIGDLDDVQRLAQVPGALPPLPAVEGEDGTDCRGG